MKLKRKVLQTACEAIGVDYERLMGAYEAVALYGLNQRSKGYAEGYDIADPAIAYRNGFEDGREDQKISAALEAACDAYTEKQDAEQIAAPFFAVSQIIGDDEHSYVTKAVDAFDKPDWRENDSADMGYYADCNCDSCQDRREALGGPRVVESGIEF